MSDLDPAHSQEGVSDDATTVTDPQVMEDAAESEEKSKEGAGAPHDDTKDQDAETFEIVVEGHEPEPEPEKDSTKPWVKELRKKHRDLATENAELKRKLQSQAQPPPAADPGPRPTLENCGFDEAERDRKYDLWKEAVARKQAVEDQGKREAQSQKEAYDTARAEISKSVPNYAEQEAIVSAALTIDRQAAMISSGVNVPKVVLALAKYPTLLEELAKETNRDRFLAKLGKLEGISKMKTKTQPPPPEKPVRGSGAPSGRDPTLEKLRADADKSRDRTAVVDYLRKKREASRGK